jgi:DNA-directed RNA polymerase specialized sigma24 family protein
MFDTENPVRDGTTDGLEKWKRAISEAYQKAFWILRKKAELPEDRALDCLNTAAQDLLGQWRVSGPPPGIENWAAYLAHAAFNVHIRPPRKDARLLVFMSPVEDRHTPIALDKPCDQPETLEISILREEFQRAWKHLVRLPKSQVVAIVLWALGLCYAEIAQILKSTESHARSLKHKGIKALKKTLDEGDSGVRSAPGTT